MLPSVLLETYLRKLYTEYQKAPSMEISQSADSLSSRSFESGGVTCLEEGFEADDVIRQKN
jgi:hypothetical protein